MSPDALRETLAFRFRALRHRSFRWFWTGQLISLVGTWMQTVAQGWLIHRLTDSALMLGLLGFCQFLPVTLLSLWAGVIVDRMDRRRLLLVTQTLMLVQAVILAALTSAGRIEAWMVLALAFGFGAVNAFDLPARQAVLVDLVNGPEDLTNAIALNSAAFNTARIAGPAVAGVLLAAVGEAGCFWLNAVSFLAVLVSLLVIRLPRRDVVVRPGLAALREGVRYAFSVTSLRNLLVLIAITAGLGFQYMTLLPAFARTLLHTDAAGYGALVSAFGLGALIAAVMMTRRLDRWDLRRNLLIGLLSSGLGLAVFAWSRSLPLSMAMGFLAGFGLILYVASTNTLLQLTTHEAYRGRVMSLYTFMFIGTAPFGALLAGAVAQRWGAPVATSGCAVVLLGGAWWVVRRLRFLRAEEKARAAAAAAEAAAVPQPEKVG